MRVIIVGAGEVGYHIAKKLSEKKRDVVLIDKDPGKIRRIAATQLQRQGPFRRIVSQQPFPVAAQHRAGGDHLGVQHGLSGQPPQKVPAMPIR